jgi:hypothetical protein
MNPSEPTPEQIATPEFPAERAPVAKAKPHNIHAVGIGRTGAAYIEALLRTGEIEDLLAAPGAVFAALLIDVGDDAIQIPDDYARSLKARLRSRGIPEDRFHYESVALTIPEKSALGKLPKDAPTLQAGTHIPRAIAKSIFTADTRGASDRLSGALQRFGDHVAKSTEPATAFIAYGLAGGTGSGMAIELARHLQGKLDKRVSIVGIGQLSHSGDGDYFNSAAQYQAIDALDAAMRSDANPFAGGFFVVSSEQSWQRLTAYTSTGLKEVRQRFKQMVTNRFVADSFMRFAMSDGSAHLLRALQRGLGKCTIFDVAKLSHPGVQVLPGEPGSKWDAVMAQWIGWVPKYSGLSDSFKTDYAEVHVHASRDMQAHLIEEAMQEVVSAAYLRDGAGYHSFRNEFFDVLTAYGNVILPGASKEDLLGYRAAKASFDKLGAGAKALEVA